MRIDPGLIGDSRTRMLRTLLDCPYAEVFILRLWCCAAESGVWRWERGALSSTFLAAVCEYPGDAAEFMGALRTSRWLVTDADGAVELADYAQLHRREIANRRNGRLGGRPRKTQAKPKRNPTETHGKPIGNPTETHGKPTGNPTETQQEPTGNPTETHGKPNRNPRETQTPKNGRKRQTQAKPSGNPEQTYRKPNLPPVEDSSYPPEDIKTPPLYVSPMDRSPEKAESRSGPMKRPTVEQVRDYCREKGYDIDPEAFVAHYQAKGWKIGKTPMKCWKSAVVTWVRNSRSSGRRADESKSYRV